MTRDDHEDDGFVEEEEVERRRDVRGTPSGLCVTLVTPRAARFDAVEASRRAFFVHVDDPDSFRLGETFDGQIDQGAERAHVRLEVVRKEIEPRRGVVLHITHIDPDSERALSAMLGPLAKAIDRADTV
jgi:hypothetical protein